MDTLEIEKIIKIFEGANVSHLELEIDNVKIKLEKNLYSNNDNTVSNSNIVNDTQSQKDTKVLETGEVITSPLVGVFYEAPSQDAKPFVKVGDRVKKGDKLCIIEAMKVMNEITSPYDGIVKECYMKNSSMVEYGSKLFRIEE